MAHLLLLLLLSIASLALADDRQIELQTATGKLSGTRSLPSALIERNEAILQSLAARKLCAIPGLVVQGDTDPSLPLAPELGASIVQFLAAATQDASSFRRDGSLERT